MGGAERSSACVIARQHATNYWYKICDSKKRKTENLYYRNLLANT